ncbi:hypothetical protein BDV18DRAFT_161742 [Aspergillus unguis]
MESPPSPASSSRGSLPSTSSSEYQLQPLSRSRSLSDISDAHSSESESTANNVDVNNSSPEHGDTLRGHPLRRFIVRGCVLLVVPPLLTIYFIVICFAYRVPDLPANKCSEHHNGQLIFYSWWVLGIFGLGMSRYGLAGAEAAMLQERLWHTENAMALLLHSGQSWSGFGGWMKCLGMLIRRRKAPAQRLWWLLCLLSLMIVIALPLSGLSMELFDGFIITSSHPEVIGHFPDTYLTTRLPGVGGWAQWRSGGSLKVPGTGIIYTPLGFDRNNHVWLREFPNRLPSDDNVTDMFLTPQAKYPVTGRPWGLRLSYNCSTVRSMSELTVLPRRDNFTFDREFQGRFRRLYRESDSIYAANSTWPSSVFAYIEQGITVGPLFMEAQRSWDEFLEHPDIIEYVMWQASLDQDKPFNQTVYPTISGMGHPIVFEDGNYRVNTTFLATPSLETDSDALQDLVHINYPDFPFDQAKLGDTPIAGLAAPTGIRCKIASQLGLATLHPDSYSFSNFEPLLPVRPSNSRNIYQRVGFISAGWMVQISTDDVLESILESTKPGPPAVDAGYTNISLLSYFQPSQIRESLHHALAIEALQLMYDGLDTFDDARLALNLTASRPGKILGPGAVPPHIPAAMLGIWACGCVVLAVRYGFRRRWSDTLDGYSFLRFGVDIADEVRGRPGLMTANKEFHEQNELEDLPGLIGDSRNDLKVGQIGLVNEGSYARRNRLYL